ncbi:MAG TPA: alpha/beta hydrolase [Candidatus Binataceae bacterium]|nr:alpha/beta hydrolase [Candidatus Binataceae bacterium]
MAELKHRIVDANGIRIHLVEAGHGPLVLMVHGFPESWYSWRHQLHALADAGFHAVAIDVRGYGRSSAPAAIDEYRMTCHVGDNLGVVEALGEQTAIIVGHDWGAPIAANSALLRPDVFRALALLSVPYSPRGTRRPTESFRIMGGKEEFYINYFQQPGRAEAEIEPDVRGWLLGFYYMASGDAPASERGATIATIPAGGKLRDRLKIPEKLPGWLSEADLDFFVEEFERTGLTGGLNRYRNVDRDWEDFAAFTWRPITVPSLFIGGEKDGPTRWGAGAISNFNKTLPALRGSHILPGCGHWVQQERPREVNELLVKFVKGL